MRLIYKNLVLLMAAALIFNFLPITSVFAYNGGYIGGITGYHNATTAIVGDTSGTSVTTLTDSNLSSGQGGSSTTGFYSYTLTSLIDINSYYVKHSGYSEGSPYYLKLYDTNKTLLGTETLGLPSSSGAFNMSQTYTAVKYVLMFKPSGIKTIYELDIYGTPTPFPNVPTGLTGTSGVEKVTLNWNLNNDGSTTGYNVYQNGLKVNLEPVTTNTFVVENVTPDINYTYEVTALGSGIETNKSTSVTLKAMNEIVYPTLNYEQLNHESVRLIWDNVASTYEIYKDGVMLAVTPYLFNTITNLEANTSYDFYIIGIDKYGRRNQSNTLTLVTLVDPPVKPILTVSDKTSTSFKVSWQLDVNANDYSVFLNGNLVDTITTNAYTFNGLTADTLYSFKIVANGDNGNVDSVGSTKTEPLPVPKINNANLSAVPDQPTKRNLTYSANEHVTAVKVYVDGQLIGEYPATQNTIELDFATIEGAFADIKIEPVDADAETYEFKGFSKSTGDENMDNLLLDFFNAFVLGENGFWYLALVSLPLVAAVVTVYFIRRKFKQTFGETKKEDAALINQPGSPIQEKVDFKEEKRKFVPWKEMTDEQKNEWRQKRGLKPVRKPLTESDKLKNISDRHEKKTGFKIVEQKIRKQNVGFLGMNGMKTKVDTTYERNGVQYKQTKIRGQGVVYQPKDFKNKVKHVSNQINAVKSAFTGSNKKKFK